MAYLFSLLFCLFVCHKIVIVINKSICMYVSCIVYQFGLGNRYHVLMIENSFQNVVVVLDY